MARVEVGLAPELGDPGGDLIGVPRLLVGVHQELLRDRLVHAGGHEVVSLVAQPTHDLGGQGGVEDVDDPLPIGVVRLGDGALLDLGPCSLAKRGDVGQELTCHRVDARTSPGGRIHARRCGG
jgi:hypothetical protein